LLIIQDHDIITTLFESVIYNKEKLADIVEKYKLGKKSEYYYFIIDPNK
jgi:hypothetical protein